MFGRKARKIQEQRRIIRTLMQTITSLEEDIESMRQEAYKTAKKPATRKKTK